MKSFTDLDGVPIELDDDPHFGDEALLCIRIADPAHVNAVAALDPQQATDLADALLSWANSRIADTSVREDDGRADERAWALKTIQVGGDDPGELL